MSELYNKKRYDIEEIKRWKNYIERILFGKRYDNKLRDKNFMRWTIWGKLYKENGIRRTISRELYKENYMRVTI